LRDAWTADATADVPRATAVDVDLDDPARGDPDARPGLLEAGAGPAASRCGDAGPHEPGDRQPPRPVRAVVYLPALSRFPIM
jgi:hypothetical protein